MVLTNGLRPYVESAEQLDELLGETLDKLRQGAGPRVAQAAPPMTAPPIEQDGSKQRIADGPRAAGSRRQQTCTCMGSTATQECLSRHVCCHLVL